MTSSKEEALSSSSGSRDRSYSDYTNPTAITRMGADTISITNNAPNNKMAITTNKKNSHPHRHHGNHRPRSKSCDRHYRHSPSVHKKNRLSPKSSSSSSSSPQQQLRGKMWIRPVAVRRSTMPFRPVLASVAPSPTASSAEQQQDEDRGGLFNNNHVTPVAPKNDFPICQVTSSPISPKSSFDSFQQHHGVTRNSSPKSARIIFGESGKPIKPRNALSLLQLR